MLTLFIDSSRKDLLLAIFKDDTVIKELNLGTNGRHSEFIMSELESMLKDLDLSLDQFDRVITTKGPGSFTGVRIGVTIAKTLCYAKKIPLYSISTLKALSYTGYENRVVVMDAKKGRVFATIVSNDQVILKDSYLEFDDLVEKITKLEGEISITCDEVYLNNESLLEYGDVFAEKVILEELINDELTEEDVITFAPDYLKLTDAEIQYNERNK